MHEFALIFESSFYHSKHTSLAYSKLFCLRGNLSSSGVMLEYKSIEPFFSLR